MTECPRCGNSIPSLADSSSVSIFIRCSVCKLEIETWLLQSCTESYSYGGKLKDYLDSGAITISDLGKSVLQ